MMVSFFNHARDNAPKPKELSWQALAELLAIDRAMPCTVETCTRKTCTHKEGFAWSPVRYREGTTRAAKNVEEVQALVLDLDDITNDQLREVFEKLDARGINAIAHSSHSDRPQEHGKRRVRVVIEIDPVPGDHWPAFWQAAVADLDLPGVDRSACDASRLYYMPSRPSDVPRLFGINAGKPFRTLYTAPLRAENATTAEVPASNFDGITADKLETAIAEMAAAFPSKNVNNTFMALSGALAKEGWSEEQIASFTEAVAHRVRSRGIDADPFRRREQARNAVSKPPERVRGWSGLDEIDGAALTRVQDALGFVDHSFDWLNGWSEPEAPAHALDASAVIAVMVPPEPAKPRLPPTVLDVVAIAIPPLRHYSTGMPQLDGRVGGGFATRGIHVIISRTGAGKSGFALGALVAQATRGLPTVYFSTELDENEITCRIAANILGVGHREILDGRVSREVAGEALRRLSCPPYVIGADHIRRGAVGLKYIEDTIALVTAHHGIPPIVAVDYIQMLVDSDPKNVRIGVSEIANELRAISQRQDCAVLAVCSSARGFYKLEKGTDDPITYLGAAKESGDVEFAAANVIFLDVANEADPMGVYVARIVVAKARRGSAGFVGARFYGPSGRWEEHAEAIAAMSAENRAERKQATRDDSDDAKLLEAIAATPHVAWRDLREIAGIKGSGSLKRADAARARLLARDAICEEVEHYADSLKRKQKRTVLRVRDPDPFASLPPSPSPREPHPAIAFLGGDV